MLERDERESAEVEVRRNEAQETATSGASETPLPRLSSETVPELATSVPEATGDDGSAPEEGIGDRAGTGRRLTGRRKGSVKRREPEVQPQIAGPALTSEQRLLILDAWRRSELPAGEFGRIAGVTAHTLYAWRRRFEDLGPAGL